MSELILAPPAPGENRLVSAEGVSSLTFEFNPDEILLDCAGADLVIEFDNGGQIVIQGILEQAPEDLPDLHIPDGIVVSMGELLHNMRYDPEPGPIMPEAGGGLLSSGSDFIEGLPGAATDGDLPAASTSVHTELAALDFAGGASTADDELQRMYAALQLNIDKL